MRVMDAATAKQRHSALNKLVQRIHPGSTVVDVAALGTDEAPQTTTCKSAGYGRPLKLTVHKSDGEREQMVFHTATANPFGHDWRADRAAEMLLAFDTFPSIPNHTTALDVGAIAQHSDDFISLRDSGEFYLLTSYATGSLYAHDLRRIADSGQRTAADQRRCKQLAQWIAAVHQPRDNAQHYDRSVRDVVGSGEGIFGIIDGYPEDAPAAPPKRLQAIEQQCIAWRWRLRRHRHRLCRIHGDFHPFNVLFDGDTMTALDASRGSVGDPANDVSCMAINYVFFALQQTNAWATAFRELWYDFWDTYLACRADSQLSAVIAPYVTWRILVLCNPVWYPSLASHNRDRLLGLAEHVLSIDVFSPQDAERVFDGNAA